MEVIDTLYTVTLQDCPDEVPERARAQAEARYAKALEQALGGPEEVAAALDTMSGLEGAADEDISQADLELAAQDLGQHGRGTLGSTPPARSESAGADGRGYPTGRPTRAEPALPGPVPGPGDRAALQHVPVLRCGHWEVHQPGPDWVGGWDQSGELLAQSDIVD